MPAVRGTVAWGAGPGCSTHCGRALGRGASASPVVLPQLKQHEFREKFRQEAPFSFSDPDPYKSLNKVFLLKEEMGW